MYSGRFCAVSTLIWQKRKKLNDKRRRKPKKNPNSHWSIMTKNSAESSRSFRMQFHWSLIHHRTMCYLRTISSTFIIVDVQSVCTPSQIQDCDSGRTKFKQGKTDGILYRSWIKWRIITQICKNLIWRMHVLYWTRKSGKGSKDTVYWVDIQLARKGLKFY